MQTVFLGGAKAAGRVARVDDADYELVMRHRWYVWERQRTGRATGPYAQTNILVAGRRTTVQMHKLIAGQWSKVDHADGDGLNNQRLNLRDGSGARNNHNQHGKLASLSGYKGVTLIRKTGRWRARIGHEGTKIVLGCFDAPEEAAHAYDAKAIEIFGEYALLNFPEAARG